MQTHINEPPCFNIISLEYMLYHEFLSIMLFSLLNFCYSGFFSTGMFCLGILEIIFWDQIHLGGIKLRSSFFEVF